METDKDTIYCKHILEAISEIEAFTQGMTFDTFAFDKKTSLAVTRELEIIGEATKRLSDGFKEQYPSIPWKKIAGMRDFLIHDYMAIDLREVWNAATKDVKELKEAVRSGALNS